MKKNNNKGITLVEIIIALSIVGFVITASYKVIIGISKFINIQKEVNLNVSNMNLLNKYLVNDIEQSKSISDLEILDDTSYKYTIVRNDTNIEYIVKKNKHKNKTNYDVIRKKGPTEVTIIERLRSCEDSPFLINKLKYDGGYKVSISYKCDDKNKEKVFNLATRLTET